MGSDGNSLLSTGRAWQLVMEPVSILIIVFMMLVALQWRADATFAALAPAAAYYAASVRGRRGQRPGRGGGGVMQSACARLPCCASEATLSVPFPTTGLAWAGPHPTHTQHAHTVPAPAPAPRA